ncbi:Cis-abienol synthase, chloroplastic [Sesamum angolense]|uniref:Cis-abienol synthase, chloroplastic n=1 Tax=Sesamum angolense TaxID=2727404 RepID=A0AAE1W917_9LAMI|nr:Cis-abienol synthase, chloroplastic [Sesamum angolense]
MVLIDGDVVVCVYLLQGFQDSIGRIREKMKGKVEITPSAYDTAWVAMVPSREDSGREPLFPQCLDWIIENQNPDGSWGLQYPGHPLLVKDSLSCTLACLVALRKWNAGDQLVKKGLEFLRSNAWAATDKHQISPIGFDIVFPMMINYANDLDFTLPFHQHLLDSMFSNRHSEIKRNPNLEYVAEGLGESFDWNKSLTQQRSNGSLFNSPATTAAAFIHTQDNNCFQYLHSVLITFKTWVPTVYPIDVYARLRMVDTLQRLGVDRYFQSEIDSILEETYRLWQQKEEEIFTDITCCAMAFRLLRIQGYEVSSDELAAFVDQERFFDTVSPQMGGVATVLELYRASQVQISEEESSLERIHAWTSKFLKQQLLNKTIPNKQLQKQVNYELKNFHGIPDRVGNRRSLELYDMDNYQVLKTAYRCPAIHNEDLFLFSRQDFNICQSQYQKELEQLERWYKDCRLDSLKFGRSVVNISHFLTCAILADPLLSDARLSYAKSIVLVTCLDDFFDHHGSREESLKILELTKQYVNEQPATAYGSEEVEILFTALYNTVNEVAAKAYIEQGRCVKHLLVSLWVEMLTSFMREMDSRSDETPPSVDEYLSFAWLSISCRSCILTSIHFLGINLSEDMVMSPEFTSLCMHVSFVARLLNDLQTFKVRFLLNSSRESASKKEEERKLNSVILMQAAHKDGGGISEEDAIWEIKKIVEFNRRKLLQMVYQRNGSIVPRECKDIFWKTSKIAYYLYSSGDEFTSPQEMMEDMKSLIYKPLELPALATS